MLSDRELFHAIINIEDNPHIYDQCKQRLQHYFSETEQIYAKWFQSDKYFEYSEEKLDQYLLNENQEILREYKYLLDNDKIKTRSREEMIYFLKQVAPAKLVDGCWLQQIFKSLPSAEDQLREHVYSHLIDIYIEELGEGDLLKNHIKIYKDLLEEIGAPMPEISSRSFIDQPDLLDSAFVPPLIQLLLSLFTIDRLPELLGFNLGFEQLPLHILTTVEELKRLNINSYYFQLHISIDNLASGHAARAATAVKKYLEYVRVRFGNEVMQEQWRRVMIGLFMNEINPLKEDLINQGPSVKNTAPNAENDMIKLIESKAPYAHNIHGHKSIHNRTLDDWLNPHELKKKPSSTKEFLIEFGNSFWISPGYPDESKFLTELCAFGGPMFCVFTDNEITVVKNWISSLSKSKQEPIASVSVNAAEVANKMQELISSKKKQAQYAHSKVTGTNNNGESKSFNEWFKGDAGTVMEVLKKTYNLEAANDEANTKFVEFFTKGRMSSYFKAEDIEVIKAWVKNGAPLPDSATDRSTDRAESPQLRPKLSPELSRALALSELQLPASVKKFDTVKESTEILNIYKTLRVKNNTKCATKLSEQADLFVQRELCESSPVAEEDHFNFRFSPELAKEIFKSAMPLIHLIGYNLPSFPAAGFNHGEFSNSLSIVMMKLWGYNAQPSLFSHLSHISRHLEIGNGDITHLSPAGKKAAVWNIALSLHSKKYIAVMLGTFTAQIRWLIALLENIGNESVVFEQFKTYLKDVLELTAKTVTCLSDEITLKGPGPSAAQNVREKIILSERLVTRMMNSLTTNFAVTEQA